MEQGKHKGRIEGQLKDKLETTRNMLNAGINRKMVLEVNSLSEELMEKSANEPQGVMCITPRFFNKGVYDTPVFPC